MVWEHDGSIYVERKLAFDRSDRVTKKLDVFLVTKDGPTPVGHDREEVRSASDKVAAVIWHRT